MPGVPSGTGAGGREVPHSLDAERGVLGSVLASRGQVLDFCLERPLTADSFVERRHRLLYETMVAIYNEYGQLDQISVASRLHDLGRLDDVGGPDYLSGLVDAVPTVAHAGHYINLVYDKHVLRRVIEASQTAADLAYAAELESQEILAHAEQAFYDIATDRATSVASFETVMGDMVTHINKMADTGKGHSGITTGFTDLDQKLLGFHPGDLIILAARPSMGKTSLALNIALNIATGRVRNGAPPTPWIPLWPAPCLYSAWR
jgi:replicative DNA helicase